MTEQVRYVKKENACSNQESRDLQRFSMYVRERWKREKKERNDKYKRGSESCHKPTILLLQFCFRALSQSV